MKRIILSIFLMGILSILLIYISIEGIANQYLYSTDNAPKADAIIVLGARVYSNGMLSLMLQDRLDFGYELYKNGKAPKILVSGDHGTKEYDEVNAMREYLLKKGVPSADIFMDHAGFDTYDSAYRARDVFLIKKAIFVSQGFHIVRAVYIGRQLGLQVYGVASDPREYAGIEYNKLREILSRAKAVLDAEILKSKPKFLGEPIPVWGNGEVTIDK
jgi:SanA protein